MTPATLCRLGRGPCAAMKTSEFGGIPEIFTTCKLDSPSDPLWKQTVSTLEIPGCPKMLGHLPKSMFFTLWSTGVAFPSLAATKPIANPSHKPYPVLTFGLFHQPSINPLPLRANDTPALPSFSVTYSCTAPEPPALHGCPKIKPLEIRKNTRIPLRKNH